MKPSLEEYCRTIDEQAEHFSRDETRTEQNAHLRAFNFGRMTQRAETTRRQLWLHVAWLLTGLVLGTILGITLSAPGNNSTFQRMMQHPIHPIDKAHR